MRGGAYDQREGPAVYGAALPYLPLAARPDVLVFETEPLAEDVEIVGPIVAELWIASSSPDTDFTIKLLDIHPPSADYPDGFDMNLTTGILRCRYRDSWEKPSPMTPGKPYRIRIEAFPTANLFLNDYVRPLYGVYVVRGRLPRGRVLDGVANLGIRPMFEKKEEILEPHFFDFTGDLYDQPIEVELLHYIRGEMKLSGLDELKSWIERDCAVARRTLAEMPHYL